MSDYDRPHEGHHSGPRRSSRDGERGDYYGGGDGERGHERKKSDDHEILGTLAGAAAGGFGGAALGNKAGGHNILGGIAGAVAGAFVGHEAEEKVEDWKEKRDEKKEHEQHGGRSGSRERRGSRSRSRSGERRRSRSGERRHSRSRSGSRNRHHEGHGDGTEITVQQGDTLRGIAARFDHVSFDEIARLNNIQNPDMIYPGQVLRIPRR